MPTPSEKYDIHSPKRYLEYTETPYYRAFRDLTNPGSAASNYAVLKSMENAEKSLAAIEEYYNGPTYINVMPKFEFTYDSVTPLESRKFFLRNGYDIGKRSIWRMTLCEKASNLFLVRRCQIQSGAGKLPQAIAALLVEYCNGQEYGLRLIEKQMIKGGAIAYVAFSSEGTPASICVGQGYGSAYCITALYTTEHQRKKGYGAAALLAAMRGAAEAKLGYDTIFLDTASENTSAVSLFEKAGFRGEEHTVYGAFKGGVPLQWKRVTAEELEEDTAWAK